VPVQRAGLGNDDLMGHWTSPAPPERTKIMDAFLQLYVIASRCLMVSLLGSVAYVLLVPPTLNLT
jgi:hypothetical protein